MVFFLRPFIRVISPVITRLLYDKPGHHKLFQCIVFVEGNLQTLPKVLKPTASLPVLPLEGSFNGIHVEGNQRIRIHK